MPLTHLNLLIVQIEVGTLYLNLIYIKKKKTKRLRNANFHSRFYSYGDVYMIRMNKTIITVPLNIYENT